MRNFNTLAVASATLALGLGMTACGSSERPKTSEQREAEHQAHEESAARQAMHPAIHDVKEQRDGSLTYVVTEFNGYELNIELYCEGRDQIMIGEGESDDSVSRSENNPRCNDGRIIENEVSIPR